MFKFENEITFSPRQVIKIREAVRDACNWNEYEEERQRLYDTLFIVEDKIWEARCSTDKYLEDVRKTLKSIQITAYDYNEYLKDNDFDCNEIAINKLEDLVKHLKEIKND